MAARSRPTDVRPYRPGDRQDLYEVCVRTGDGGADATGLFTTDDLLPDVFLGPYLAIEPGLAFVVDTGERASGYVVAAADTERFVAEHRRRWLPRFAATYPLTEPATTPEERLVLLGHRPEAMLALASDRYPAHLHIDLLPDVQGRGLGRALIRLLLGALRARGVPGVHLGVGARNTAAIAFYERLGFATLPAPDDATVVLGLSTSTQV
ncbi:GNAT family N-acetyltransferase [Nocardioides sp. YIM 152315]|uniref:GNAT family N-acetyltransferase n=1 Tax=Nocardioides sp. YIM 152315 TaxID=3031760 RepID=UPI0023DB5D6B|nr:GNAT family N-acetyltransferase [Nocardioides sp. YIM 152315]MDF1605377.1 GNAT family N-acetyltransferase [Nocardioides sp. YIM 152315]